MTPKKLVMYFSGLGEEMTRKAYSMVKRKVKNHSTLKKN